MASVFLSYDHEDAARAAPIAAALEKAGHSVWWDQRIAAGAEYNNEIEGAVERADAVVVLWSERSVRSAWVRDEAAEGRDRGKLVPATIDVTKPPMGFRQYQTIDLSKRKRTGGLQNMDELLRVVGNMAAGDKVVAEERPDRAPPRGARPSIKWPVFAAVLLALIAGGALLAWRMLDRPSVPIVAVVPAERSAEAEAMARDLLVKLGSLRAAKTDGIRLIGAGPGRAEFIFEASGGGSTRPSEATLALLAGKDRTILWSRAFRQEANTQADLDQQMAYTAGQVLDCALEASQPGQQRINQDTLKLFLNGCALFADRYRTDPRAVVPIFLQVLESAPHLQPAWRKLLLAESLFTRTERSLGRHTPGEMPNHIAAARKLNPNIAELYVAESTLVPMTAYARRSDFLERAVRLAPDNPDLLLTRAEFHVSVGRMSEAVDDATRAVEINPLSPGLRSHMIADLAYAGRIDTALQELRRAEQLWPESAATDDARSRLYNRYGDPELGLRMLRSGATRGQPMVSSTIEAFLLARIDPTEVNVRRAIDAAESRASTDTRSLADLVQAAGEFHREEELYQLLQRWRRNDMLGAIVEVFFRPPLRKFRQDPRFMLFAKRLGLVDYWRATGKWPDFCFEPDLPYDCKAEAAKLT